MKALDKTTLDELINKKFLRNDKNDYYIKEENNNYVIKFCSDNTKVPNKFIELYSSSYFIDIIKFIDPTSELIKIYETPSPKYHIFKNDSGKITLTFITGSSFNEKIFTLFFSYDFDDFILKFNQMFDKNNNNMFGGKSRNKNPKSKRTRKSRKSKSRSCRRGFKR